jgi:hypothetical protein
VRVILKPEVYRIRNGFAARSPELGLAAHGASPEIARRNLERTVLYLLKPLEREGCLETELRRSGLEVDEGPEELTVAVAD